VQQDGPGDPRVGAIGGSYGGGYQFVGAFGALADQGKPLFDALAPEITWWSLQESLAPNEVVKTEWDSALTAAGAGALPPEVLQAFAVGAATGEWPKGQIPGVPNLNAFLEKNGPQWQVAHGRRLNIPVLFGQGITDSLFPLTQGLKNWKNAITPAARAKSIFVGYNGGHVLPTAFPQTVGVASDPCSKELAGGSFSALALRFMKLNLKGENTGLTGFGKFHLATPDGEHCTTTTSVAPNTDYKVDSFAAPTGAGAPSVYKLASGPVRVAGTPRLSATIATAGIDQRSFFALAVGTSLADAKVVQGNVMPYNQHLPSRGAARTFDLPSVAVDVPAGQSLFLLVTPIDDMFAGMGSRAPGVIVLKDVVVRVPVVK
jgi:ABC-2 type transport system ATP-binding protein